MITQLHAASGLLPSCWGWGEDWKTKNVRTCAEENKEFIHPFPCPGRCSAMPRKSGLHHVSQWLGKSNATTPNVPLFLLFSPAPSAEQGTIWYGMCLGSVGVSCSRYVPSQLPVNPKFPWWGGMRSRRGLDSVLALLSINENIPVLPTLYPAQIQYTAHTSCCD